MTNVNRGDSALCLPMNKIGVQVADSAWERCNTNHMTAENQTRDSTHFWEWTWLSWSDIASTWVILDEGLDNMAKIYITIYFLIFGRFDIIPISI